MFAPAFDGAHEIAGKGEAYRSQSYWHPVDDFECALSKPAVCICLCVAGHAPAVIQQRRQPVSAPRDNTTLIYQ